MTTRITEGPLHTDEVLARLGPGESVEVHPCPRVVCPVCPPLIAEPPKEEA